MSDDEQQPSDLKKALAESKSRRKAMERQFGFVPSSVLRLGRGALSKSMYVYQHERPGRMVSATSEASKDSYTTEELRQKAQERADMGVVGGRLTRAGNPYAKRQAASIMPAELVEFFVKYYAAPGQTYIDPFMGQGIQLQVAHLMGLEYWGMDLSREFFDYIEAVMERILAERPDPRIYAFHGDSRHPDLIPDGIGDFSFHSPPYWDVEHYGDEPEQLGNGTYEEFLAGMEQVARAWLPKFKPGAWHVVNVNDFRREGRFYPYHADTIALFQRAGWELHDTWIIDGLVGGLTRIFGVDKNAKRTAPKVHEYALVFRRP